VTWTAPDYTPRHVRLTITGNDATVCCLMCGRSTDPLPGNAVMAHDAQADFIHAHANCVGPTLDAA
jgi:hypothetical protein